MIRQITCIPRAILKVADVIVAATIIMVQVLLHLRRKARRVAHQKVVVREETQDLVALLLRRKARKVAHQKVLVREETQDLVVPGLREDMMIAVKDRARAAHRKAAARGIQDLVAYGPRVDMMILAKGRAQAVHQKGAAKETQDRVALGRPKGTADVIVVGITIMDRVPPQRKVRRVVALQVVHRKEVVRGDPVLLALGPRMDATTVAAKVQAQAVHRKEVAKEILDLAVHGQKELTRTVKLRRKGTAKAIMDGMVTIIRQDEPLDYVWCVERHLLFFLDLIRRDPFYSLANM